MPTLASAAPQLLVAKLPDALAFYEQRLGFTVDFVYADFYASVSRGGAVLHLKCGERPASERAARCAEEHLDAYIAATGVRALHDELLARGAPIANPLGARPWGTLDFHVEDPDGNALCFSESA